MDKQLVFGWKAFVAEGTHEVFENVRLKRRFSNKSLLAVLALELSSVCMFPFVVYQVTHCCE